MLAINNSDILLFQVSNWGNYIFPLEIRFNELFFFEAEKLLTLWGYLADEISPAVPIVVHYDQEHVQALNLTPDAATDRLIFTQDFPQIFQWSFMNRLFCIPSPLIPILLGWLVVWWDLAPHSWKKVFVNVQKIIIYIFINTHI